MNTTHLIRHWSMNGASRDLAGRFRRADDIRAAIASDTVEDEHGFEPIPVLLKQAGEEQWTTLTPA